MLGHAPCSHHGTCRPIAARHAEPPSPDATGPHRAGAVAGQCPRFSIPEPSTPEPPVRRMGTRCRPSPSWLVLCSGTGTETPAGAGASRLHAGRRGLDQPLPLRLLALRLLRGGHEHALIEKHRKQAQRRAAHGVGKPSVNPAGGGRRISPSDKPARGRPTGREPRPARRRKHPRQHPNQKQHQGRAAYSCGPGQGTPEGPLLLAHADAGLYRFDGHQPMGANEPAGAEEFLAPPYPTAFAAGPPDPWGKGPTEALRRPRPRLRQRLRPQVPNWPATREDTPRKGTC